VHEDGVLAPDVLAELAHRFEEGEALDVPTVPPISTITTSASWATARTPDLISSVMCGITWTVRPR